MGDRTKYTPGTFCWTDLTTTDQPGAKAFYGELFGWDFTDNPVGDGVYYSMAHVDGKPVGAISPQPQQQRDAGVPPVWNSYISVESADQVLDHAQRLGATIHAPAFDVMDVGRMGVVQDPQAAYVLVWQPKTHPGASLVNAPGALSWNELATADMNGSAGFYSELFGWQVEPIPDMDPPYSTIRTAAGANNGGIRPVTPPGTPPHWLVYFGTDDIDAALAKVSELGGTPIFGPTDIGRGKIGLAQDPQGAFFALYAGTFEP
jgi:predicted enzyme related to lactoylglutathione lyase